MCDRPATHRPSRGAPAAVRVLGAGDARIRLELTSKADPALYDLPLTLVTRVPAGWRGAKVSQGERSAAAPVRDGTVRFRAVPNGGSITLTAAAAPPAAGKPGGAGE